MKRNQYAEDHISILKTNQRGVSIADLARRSGVTKKALYALSEK